jgi:KDO2-lipid IV(A) lauroyltransferase
MQDILKRTVALLLSAYGRYIRVLSWEGARSSGAKIGLLLARLSRKRYKITLDNISKAFPEKSLKEVKSIAASSYRNLGITMAELLKSENCTDSEIMGRVVYRNPMMISRLHSRGKGLILLSGHYGNWEFLAITAGLLQDETVNVIVKYQNNDTVNKKLISLRGKWGNNIIDMGKAARPMLEVINHKGILALLADQRATKDKDVYVDFFGRKAATHESPAALSFKYDIPIVMGFANRLPDGRYEVELKEVDRIGLERFENPVEELTGRHVKILEDHIRKRPELWAWQHNRWKFDV